MALKNLAIGSFLLGAFIFLWGTSAFAEHLGESRPRQPDPVKGLTVARQFKGGTLVYISQADIALESGISVAGLVLCVVGLAGLERARGAPPKA